MNTYKPPAESTSATAIFCLNFMRSGHNSQIGSKRMRTSATELKTAPAKNAAYMSTQEPWTLMSQSFSTGRQ